MKRQDKLWKTGHELVFVMRELQSKLINEAQDKGWAGFTRFSLSDDSSESLVEVFANEQEQKDVFDGTVPSEPVGNCWNLINKLGFDPECK